MHAVSMQITSPIINHRDGKNFI